MASYSFKRRTFLQGLGGAVGLKILLRNLEAAATGAKSPPRLLIVHWPVGTVRPDFIPVGANTGSPILQPFGDAGLGGDVTTFLGFSSAAIPATGIGGHEAGMLKLMTGVGVPGNRMNPIQPSDGYAGGPSFDQIFLKHAAALRTPAGPGYANSIGDSRVDFMETSSQCLSYSHATQPVTQYNGTMGTENVPLMPELSPLMQWTKLFSGFMPGGTGGAGGASGAEAAMLRALRQRKSVLDLSLRQLARIRSLAPASEAAKIDIHTAAIRQVETQLAAQIQSQGTATPPACLPAPTPPSATIIGKTGSKFDYGNAKATEADSPMHAMVGQTHFDVLKAAFVCDLIRVSTFQWASAVSKVAFKGLLPGDLEGSYMHHPQSHLIGSSDTVVAKGPSRKPTVDFLSSVHAWYNTQMASVLKQWKATTDGFGGNLLDMTAIPFLTDVAAAGHEHNNLPALLLGGKALGFQHGRYVNFVSPGRPIADLWLTIAQAFGLSATTAPLNGEKFVAEGRFTGPVDGVWVKPA